MHRLKQQHQTILDKYDGGTPCYGVPYPHFLLPLDVLSENKDIQTSLRDDITALQNKLAHRDTDVLCRHGEQLSAAHNELRSLRDELKEAELKEKLEECRLEKDKLDRSMKELEDLEVTSTI